MPPPDPSALLLLQFLAWVADRPRGYAETMAAWRTSCPRLQVWEDAMDGGFVALTRDARGGLQVVATPRGRALLDEKPLDAKQPPIL